MHELQAHPQNVAHHGQQHYQAPPTTKVQVMKSEQDLYNYQVRDDRKPNKGQQRNGSRHLG